MAETSDVVGGEDTVTPDDLAHYDAIIDGLKGTIDSFDRSIAELQQKRDVLADALAALYEHRP